MNYTEDHFLDGRVVIRQPIQGYRVAIDSILLAGAVSAEAGENILDVGAGVGAVGLCLASRFSNLKIMGIECQKDLVRLATDNIFLNNFRDRVEVLHGNLKNTPPRLVGGSYSQVVSNPPYFDPAHGRLSSFSSKSHSNHFETFSIEDWCRFCLLMLKPLGKITFVYRADMLDHLLSSFYGKIGDISIFPLWTSRDRPAKRVIIQGVKGIKGGINILRGMFLHNADGSFTKEAEAILRDGQPISLDMSCYND